MKRIAILLIAALVAVGAASAQGRGPMMGGGQGNGQGYAQGPMAQQLPPLETVKAEGKLAVVNGRIAIKAADKTYYVRGFNHLIGFVDGLKEGASVKVEGYAAAIPMAPEYLMMRVTKLTFNGKDYDLSQVAGPQGMMGRGMMDGDRDGDRDGMGRGRR